MHRHTILTVDFINRVIFGTGEMFTKSSMMPELVERFVSDVVDPFWHSSKDRLDFITFYSDDTYFCQRSKLKTDFTTESTFWVSYSFTGATKEQALEFRKVCIDFFGVVLEVKNIVVDAKIREIEEEKIFFEQRWLKKNFEKNTMLAVSDWRVLPDVPESYEGERDEWIRWRSILRSHTLLKPSDFESNLEFFRYSYDIKYPVDPKQYRLIYPDGLTEDGEPAPAYLDENDPNQWVSHDLEASSDFINERSQGIYALGGQYKQSYKKIRSSILELMKILQVDTLVDFDWDKYYTENDPNFTFE